MLSFLNLLRGPQSDFLPDREVRHLRPATERDARAGLKLVDLASATSGQLEASEPEAPDPAILQAAIRVLKAQLRVADKGAAKAKAVLDSYERKAARVRAQIRDLKKAKAAAKRGQRRLRKLLRLARREAKQREADLQERLDIADTRVRELSADNDRLQSVKVQLSDEHTAASARVQVLESKLTASEAEGVLLRAELRKRDDQIEAGKTKLSEAMTLLHLEKERTESLEARVAQLTRQLVEQDVFFTLEIDALTLSSDMYESQEQEALAQVEHEHKARTTAEQERDAMQTERDQALADVAFLKQTVSDQGGRIAELEEQYLAETLRSDALIVERNHHLERLQDVENALGDANTQYFDAKQVSKQLRKDLLAMQEAYNNTQVLLTLANGSDEVMHARIIRLEKDNRELRVSKQALVDSMFNKVQDCEAANSELFKLRNASQDSISVPSTPTRSGFGSGPGSRASPLGPSLAFNFAPQLEAASPKPLRKARSFRKFFVSAPPLRVCAFR